jgi:hypothetical protein
MTTIIIRDPQVIATEINIIKEQTREFVLDNSVKIGRKLVEAKQSVGHGEWGKWLEQYVNYSHSTANNLMNMYEEYGNKSNSESIANLGLTQALALMGLPSEEREEFLKENDIDKMSTRDLKQAIKDKQRLENQLKDAQDAAEADRIANEEAIAIANADSQLLINSHNELVLKLNEDLQTALKTAGENGTAKKLKADLDKAKLDLTAAQDFNKTLQERIKNKEFPKPVEKIPEETTLELAELRKAKEDLAAQILKANQEADQKIAAMQSELEKNNNTELISVRTAVKALSHHFEVVLSAIGEIKNPDEREALKNNVKVLLDRLKDAVV